MEYTQKLDVLCTEVRNEVTRAVSLHGGMKSQNEAYAVILEELDEFWDLVKINPKKTSTRGTR